MDVHPTKNGIFIGIDPYPDPDCVIHVLVIFPQNFQHGALSMSAIFPAEFSRRVPSLLMNSLP